MTLETKDIIGEIASVTDPITNEIQFVEVGGVGMGVGVRTGIEEFTLRSIRSEGCLDLLYRVRYFVIEYPLILKRFERPEQEIYFLRSQRQMPQRPPYTLRIVDNLEFIKTIEQVKRIKEIAVQEYHETDKNLRRSTRERK